MSHFTLLADGVTRSTSELDMMFDDARDMPTKNAFGASDSLLLAMQAEALAKCFERRHKEFGDGAGSAGEWYARAARHYQEHAAGMMGCARSMWNRK